MDRGETLWSVLSYLLMHGSITTVELITVVITLPADVKFNRYIEVYHREHDPPDHSLFDDQIELEHSNLVNSSDAGT